MEDFNKFGLKNIEYLAEGKRSDVYTALYKNKNVALKVEKEGIGAKNIIKNEARFLRILNKYNIGPKLVLAKNNFIVYEFVNGTLLVDNLRSKNLKLLLKKVLMQCRILDKLKINKEEFHHPIKHVFVDKNKIGMIDFERCHFTDNPKNVTQFCQFLLNFKLVKEKEKFIIALKEYKHKQTEKNFKKLLTFL